MSVPESAPNTYHTVAIGEAAFLATKGHRLLRLEGEPGGRRTSMFDGEAAEDAEDYYCGGTSRLARSLTP